MRKLILLAAVLTCSAHAQELMFHSTDGQLVVRLTQADCALPELAAAIIGTGAITPPRAAAITAAGREVLGCYAVDSDGDVLIADEQGHGGYLPMSAFKAAPGV